MKSIILFIFITISTYCFGQINENKKDSIVKICYNLCDSITKTKSLKLCSSFDEERYCNLFGGCEFYKIVNHNNITYKFKCIKGKYLCICYIKKDFISYDKISNIKSEEKTTLGEYKNKTLEFIREIPGYNKLDNNDIIYITHEPLLEVVDMLNNILKF